MKIRVGFGFDVHQLVAGRDLWLGGIRLEHEKGLWAIRMPTCWFTHLRCFTRGGKYARYRLSFP